MDQNVNIMITSNELIKNLNSNIPGCYHIDVTYKLIDKGFHLLVFGKTDFEHQLHPIAFAIISHQTAPDFELFYKGLDI